MRPSTQQRIEAIRAKRAQMDAELARLEGRVRSETRKLDTRRKILIGAVVMQEMESQPDIDAWIRKLLNERLLKNRDRVLFDLAELPSPAPSFEAP